MSNAVTQVLAAPSASAIAHFQAEFTFETDCWDVNDAMKSAEPGFVLVDVRGAESYAKGHVPGAINIPHGKLIESKLERFPRDMLFVVYCAGPHCNGAARGALRLATLGRPVKLMSGGMTGWIDEGFEIQRADVTS